MSLLSPLALLFGLLAIPLVALYLLKLRRRERRVSSVFLWQQVIRDLEANAPWQKLRPDILLFLQLLALAALVFSLARPVFWQDSGIKGDLILILDGSASMQAADVSPTRFGAARQKALELVDRLPSGRVASVILMGDTPGLLAAQSSDKGHLREVISGAQPGSGGADLEAALSLAASLVQAGGESEVVVLSDGNVSGFNSRDNLPFTLRHEPVGTLAPNLSVNAFSTRRTASGLEGLARVSNYGPETGLTSLELYADQKLYDVREIEVSPGEDRVVQWPALPEAAVFEARLVPGDIFPLDDRAWAAGGPGREARALLVTAGNRFLEKALSLQPGLELTVAAPENFSGLGDYDIRIFDGYLPGELPRGAVLVLDPPANGEAPWVIPDPAPVEALKQRESALMQHVDLSEVHIRESVLLQPPPEAQILLESSRGCLAAAWDEPHVLIAALAFDLHDSDLPLQPAFPILIRNLVNWLLPGMGSGLAAHPGELVDVPITPEARKARVETPGGRLVQIAPPFPPEPLLIDEVGVYRVIQELEGRELVSHFVVNLFQPGESDLSLSELPLVSAGTAGDRGSRPVPRDLTSWLALAALAVLILEWWVYRRGY